jgi:hypothetical protein
MNGTRLKGFMGKVTMADHLMQILWSPANLSIWNLRAVKPND